MEYLLGDKEQIDYWCELQRIPLKSKKIQKPFKQFPKGTPFIEVAKWVAENGPYNSMQLDYEFLIRPEPSEDGEIDHPYLKYRGVGFRLEPFIEMTRKYPGNFTHYCEIVMTENGIIYLAAPSHFYVEERLTKKGYSNLCTIWYKMAICHALSPMQEKNIRALQDAGLLSKHFKLSCV